LAVAASGIDRRLTPSSARSFGRDRAVARDEDEQEVVLTATHDEGLDDVRWRDAACRRGLGE
jgi:hypothetical protein